MKLFTPRFSVLSFLLFLPFRELFCLLFFFPAVTLHAATLEAVSVDREWIALGPHIQFMQEQDQPWSWTQALRKFETSTPGQSQLAVLNFGIDAAPVWLVFAVQNDHAQAVKRRLVLENSWLDEVSFYLVGPLGQMREYQLGDSRPFDQRPLLRRFLSFDFDYPPGQTRVLIRAATPDPMLLPLYFGTSEQLDRRVIAQAYSYGFLYGVILALLLYNLILYLGIRQHRYLFYVVYLAMFMMMNLTYTGHAYQWLWPDFPRWQQWSNPFFIMLYGASGILFALSFLNVRRHFPRLDQVLKWLVGAALLAQGLMLLLQWQDAAVQFSIAFVFVFSGFTLWLSILCLSRSMKETIYFLLATLASIIGATITAMTVWDALPYSEWSYRAVEIGTAIDVILLSIALAEQFNQANSEKIKAQDLARIDPLSGLYNRRAFYELSQPLVDAAHRYQHDMSMMMLDIDRFKVINDSWGHLAGDEVLRQLSTLLRSLIRKGDVAARWGGEEFVVFLPETSHSNALRLAERLRREVEALQVLVDGEMILFSVSLGVVSAQLPEESLDDLLKRADERLYQAKSSGRNRVNAVTDGGG